MFKFEQYVHNWTLPATSCLYIYKYTEWPFIGFAILFFKYAKGHLKLNNIVTAFKNAIYLKLYLKICRMLLEILKLKV